MAEKTIKCPKCGSDNVKKAGPFAPRKREGMNYSAQPHPAQYHCWACGFDWSD